MNRKADRIKKIIAHVIPGIVIIIFALTLASGWYFKKLPAGQQIRTSLLELAELTSRSSWHEALDQVEELEKAWLRLAPKLQISSEDQELIEFTNSILRLKAYIKAEERGSAMAEVSTMSFLWQRLGK